MNKNVGVVAIGRNEGERLTQCLHSLTGRVSHVVYVDSGSTDGSQELAQSVGAEVVELTSDRPFSASRARNAGAARLAEIAPELQFVQFLDGDCTLAEDWLAAALAAMDSDPRNAVICGRRRERHRSRSLYNRLCDMEWNTPIGEARACGGDALMRLAALQQVGGFDETVIAGEEPELCVRLRQRNWKIQRIDAEMTLHDAAMLHFRQWWLRMKRAGHAYAEGAARHGSGPDQHYRQESRSIWWWGLLWPGICLGGIGFTHGVSLLGLLAYPAWIVRVAVRRRKQFRDDVV